MFYDIFMELCREQGKDPYAVPPKVGYRSNSVVAQWKEGSTPRGKYLDNLCKYFNVSKQHLLGLDKETPPTPEGEGRLSKEDAELFELIRSLPEDFRKREIAYLREYVNRSNTSSAHQEEEP